MRSDLEALIAQARAVPDDVRLPVAADVLACVVDNAREGGSFRYLIYDRLGFGPEAYYPLYIAGGQAITNHFSLHDREEESTLPEPLKRLEEMAKAAPMVPHPTLVNSAGEAVKWPSEERSALFSAVFMAAELVNMNAQLQEVNRQMAARCERLERTLAPDGEKLPEDSGASAADSGARAPIDAMVQVMALIEHTSRELPEHIEALQTLREAMLRLRERL